MNLHPIFLITNYAHFKMKKILCNLYIQNTICIVCMLITLISITCFDAIKKMDGTPLYNTSGHNPSL